MHYINRMKDKKDVKDRKVIGKEKHGPDRNMWFCVW